MGYIKNLRKVSVNIASIGTTTLVTGGTLGTGFGSIKVWQVLLNGGGANVITPTSNATLGNPPTVFTGAGSAEVLQNTETPWFETLPGQSLGLNTTTTATVTGTLWYSLA